MLGGLGKFTLTSMPGTDGPNNHSRKVSVLENFKELPSEIAATLPRAQNGVMPAFGKLVDGNVDSLNDELHAHRIRLGGLAIAPLKDLIQILGDGRSQGSEAGAAEYLENIKLGH